MADHQTHNLKVAGSSPALAPILVLALSSCAMPECPPGKVCLDPALTSCFVFDMTPANWQMVSKDERLYISSLYYNRKADYKFQTQGVDCYERDKYFVLGDKVATFPVEWWKPRQTAQGGRQ